MGKGIDIAGALISIDVLTRFYSGQSIIENTGINFLDAFETGLTKTELLAFGFYYVHSAFKCINDYIGED